MLLGADNSRLCSPTTRRWCWFGNNAQRGRIREAGGGRGLWELGCAEMWLGAGVLRAPSPWKCMGRQLGELMNQELGEQLCPSQGWCSPQTPSPAAGRRGRSAGLETKAWEGASLQADCGGFWLTSAWFKVLFYLFCIKISLNYKQIL